jgi:hypothetical protein
MLETRLLLSADPMVADVGPTDHSPFDALQDQSEVVQLTEQTTAVSSVEPEPSQPIDLFDVGEVNLEKMESLDDSQTGDMDAGKENRKGGFGVSDEGASVDVSAGQSQESDETALPEDKSRSEVGEDSDGLTVLQSAEVNKELDESLSAAEFSEELDKTVLQLVKTLHTANSPPSGETLDSLEVTQSQLLDEAEENLDGFESVRNSSADEEVSRQSGSIGSPREAVTGQLSNTLSAANSPSSSNGDVFEYFAPPRQNDFTLR